MRPTPPAPLSRYRAWFKYFVGMGCVSPIIRPIGTIAAAGLLLVAACTSGDNSQVAEPFPFVGSEQVRLPELLNPSRDGYLLSGNRLYTVDTKKKQVLVFTDRGALVRTIGREGHGPGEFWSPSNLDIRGDRLVVSEESGKVSLFDTTGTYLSSFVAAGITHIGGNIKFLNDSLLVITGLRSGKEPFYTGTMAHLYTTDGILLRDFLWLSDKAKRYEASGMTYVQCDQGGNAQTFWCVQCQEYTVYHYDHEGVLLDSLAIVAPHYRPLNSMQPKDKIK